MAPRSALPSERTATVSEPETQVVQVTRALLRDLFGAPEQRGFAVRLWNGVAERPSPGRPTPFTLVLKRPGALARMLQPITERNLGEAYLRGDTDVEGDLEAAVGLLRVLIPRFRSKRNALQLYRKLNSLPAGDLPEGAEPSLPLPVLGRSRTRTSDAAALRHHYDAGNDFFSLWLDRRMICSCGYFPSGKESLDAAQEAKLELICRKLRLRRGERLLDIGCGWGGLVLYAAERYGVQATGITLSEPQAQLARERIARAGLESRCRIEVLDYHRLPADARFDKIVSIGAVEHLGRSQLGEYYGTVWRLLRPGGLFLHQGIVTLQPPRSWLGQRISRLLRPWSSFVERYVVAGGELLPPSDMLSGAERAGFELRDAESLREHYAQTLRHWIRRLETHRTEAAATVGEPRYRIWRLFMAGSAHAFTAGHIGVLQLLLGKRDAHGALELPRTRAELYAR